MPPVSTTPLPALDVGEGPVIVLLHGFGMEPRTYERTATLLAERGARVVVPYLFAVPGRWTVDHAVECLEATADATGAVRLTLLGHSFGGALELRLAARRPERVEACVFSDTLAVSERMSLALEAVHPLGLTRMVTRTAVGSFARTAAQHPVQLARSALWAFAHDRQADIEAVVDAGIPCHVLWAERDTILDRADGRAFANVLGATFTVAERQPGGPPIDHDWMFDDPELFVDYFVGLELDVMRSLRAREM